MASNVAVSPSNGPLAGFAKLSPNVSIYRPDSSATGSATSPKLILVLTWMAARDVHIAKYTTQYQALYPTAQILLVRCSMAHMLPFSTAVEDTKPAAAAIRAALPPGTTTTTSSSPQQQQQQPELLIHSFSNGGSAMLRHLYGLYGSDPLPPHATIFDSAPGLSVYGRNVTALSQGGSLAMLAAAHLFAVTAWLMIHVARRPDRLAVLAAAHNLKGGGNAREVRRTYVFSRADELVDWRHIEAHAREAEGSGFRAPRMEEFVGSPHVAHARADGERYWRIVRETWEGKTEE